MSAGYREEPQVAPGSRTPTYAAAALRVGNARWEGVPFFLCAGKGLDARATEIRVRFRDVAANMFCELGSCPEPNELIIRVQPDEAILLKITSKVPGIGFVLEPRPLDLRYRAAFQQEIPDAYESLLLDVIRGEKSLFIRDDELAAAWDIFTPILDALERRGVEPEPYPFGGDGPAGARALAARHGVRW
jgi:glucose-6-phosphate 1-dehydrogenase